MKNNLLTCEESEEQHAEPSDESEEQDLDEQLARSEPL